MQQQIQQSLVKELLKSIEQQNKQIVPNDISTRDFQWFDLETKIRMLVYELLEPHLKEFIVQRTEHQNLSIRLNTYVSNYEEFKDQYSMNGKGQDKILGLQQEMELVVQKQKDMEFKINYDNAELNTKMDCYLFAKQQQQQEMKQIDIMIDEMQEQLLKSSQQNETYKSKLLENVEEFQKQFVQNYVKLNEQVLSLSNKIDNQGHSLQDFKEKLYQSSERLAVFQEHLSSNTAKITSNINQTEIIRREQTKLDQLLITDSQLQGKLTMMNCKLMSLENYIEKYFGLYLQGCISDTLHSCLDQQSKYKLAQYEEMRFTELHKIILNDDGQARLSETINSYGQLIEKTQKRNMLLLRVARAQGQQTTSVHSQRSEQSQVVSQQLSLSSDNSSNIVGISNNNQGQVQISKKEIQLYIQEVLNMQSKNQEGESQNLATQVMELEKNVSLLHDKLISNWQSIQVSFNDQLSRLHEQLNEQQLQYSELPKYIQEITDIQTQQQNSFKKLLQYSIIQSQLNMGEIIYNGQTYTNEQALELAGRLLQQLRVEQTMQNSNSRLRTQTQYTTNESEDETRKIRIKTTQSGFRKTNTSQSRTLDNRKLYLLGSKMQQEITQTLSDGLVARKTNSKLLFISKKQ